MDESGKLNRRSVVAGAALALSQVAAAKAQLPLPQKQPSKLPTGARTLPLPQTLSATPRAIARKNMTTTLFIDAFGGGEALVGNMTAFDRRFPAEAIRPAARESVRLFFANGGARALIFSVNEATMLSALGCGGGGLPDLEGRNDLDIGLIAAPFAADLPANEGACVYDRALAIARERKAVLLVDAPAQSGATLDATALLDGWVKRLGLDDPHAAIYAPRLLPSGGGSEVPASGAVAGVIARTDARRGVWKAPAGTEASIRNAAPAQSSTNAQQEILNPQGVNLIRTLPGAGAVVWGARTMSSDPEWKYIPVRRLAMMIDKSLEGGLSWTETEANGAPLWTAVMAAAEDFMNSLFRDGAFAGASAKEAYFVRCDSSTTTAADINAGRANLTVGFAPLKPAEFIVRNYQLAAQKT